MNQFENNYISHHGIKGMKWGVRRYQNPDGTLTAAGRRRLGLTADEASKLSEEKVHNVAYTNAASDYSNLGKGMQSGSNISRSSSSALSKLSKRKKRKIVDKENISELTDKELQQRVNRMNLERNYKSLKADQISLGRDAVIDYLDVGGDVLAGLGSAAMIASTLLLLKRGGGSLPVRSFF